MYVCMYVVCMYVSYVESLLFIILFIIVVVGVMFCCVCVYIQRVHKYTMYVCICFVKVNNLII